LKSFNGGGSWNLTGESAADVWSLAIDPQNPQTLYAGTDFDGVLKSTNGGADWSPVNTGLKDTAPYYAFQALAIDPKNSQTLYAGTDGGGVFKSTDGGDNWSPTGEVSGNVWSLVIDPQNSQTLYAGTYGGGVYKSINGGANWTASNMGLTNLNVYALAIGPQSPQTVYAVTGSEGVFKYESTIYVSKIVSCSSHSPCFPNIQNGIDSASEPSVIEITQDTYNEDVVLNFDQEIMLKGGWDTNFTSNASSTTIQGSITITNGTMFLENIILK